MPFGTCNAKVDYLCRQGLPNERPSREGGIRPENRQMTGMLGISAAIAGKCNPGGGVLPGVSWPVFLPSWECLASRCGASSYCQRQGRLEPRTLSGVSFLTTCRETDAQRPAAQPVSNRCPMGYALTNWPVKTYSGARVWPAWPGTPIAALLLQAKHG